MRLRTGNEYARWVLCAAMLFVAYNTGHAIEHDFSGDLGQSHAECHHCSTEHSSAVCKPVVDLRSREELAPAQALPGRNIGLRVRLDF